MPSAKTPRSKRKTRKSKTRKANSVSPQTNLFSTFMNAVMDGKLNAVKRLVRKNVFEHPVAKKKCDDLAKVSIHLLLRARNEMEKQRRIKIFEILAREEELFDFTPNNIPHNAFPDSWKIPILFETLIDRGFDINTQDDEKNTILILVVAAATLEEEGANFNQTQYTRLINQLFDLGGDVNIQNDFGLDAVMIAGGHLGVEEYFGVNAVPNVHYLKLILDNLKKRKLRYNIYENKAAEVNDANADEYTLLEEYSYMQDNDMTDEYREAKKLLTDYEKILAKPTKSATRR